MPAALVEWLMRFRRENALAPNTEKTYTTAVNAFVRWSGGKLDLAEAALTLSDFVRDRSSRGSPYTTAGYRRAILTILRFAARFGAVALPETIRGVKLPDLQPRALTHGELTALLAACRHHAHGNFLRAAMLLGYDTGLRRGDVLAARWDQVGADNVLRVVASKSSRRLSRTLTADTLAACQLLKRAADMRLVPWPYNHSSWSKAWRGLRKRAGVNVPECGMQMIRRSAASYTKLNGGDASAILGHSARSGGLAERFYLDPRICDVPPPLPPPIFQ